MEKYDFSPYAEVTWESEIKAIRVKWNKLHLKMSDFEEIVGKAFEVMKQNNGYIWIADMYDSEGVFPKEVVDYISADSTTEASRSLGLKWALTIMPKKSGLSSLSTKAWNKSVEELDVFVVEQFPDFDTCEKWIEAQLKTMSAQ